MADEKITELSTELTTFDGDELFVVEDDPNGVPETQKVSIANLLKGDKPERFYIVVLSNDTALEVGDGIFTFTVPLAINGYILTDCDIAVYTVSSSGLPTVQIHNLTDAVDMLTTEITIDEGEYNSYTAATQPVIDTDHDDVATGDRLRIDVDVAGTDTEGLDVILVFQTP